MKHVVFLLAAFTLTVVSPALADCDKSMLVRDPPLIMIEVAKGAVTWNGHKDLDALRQKFPSAVKANAILLIAPSAEKNKKVDALVADAKKAGITSCLASRWMFTH